MAKKMIAPQIKGGPNTALLVIDVQRGLFWQKTPIYQAEQLLDNIHTLVRKAHQAGAPVVYVQHSSDKLLVIDSSAWQLHQRLSPLPDDLHIDKRQGDAFEETPLMDELERLQVGTVVTCGLVTHGCVRATTLGALQRGYRVVLAGDTHSSFSKNAAKQIKQWNANLAEAGAKLRPASDIEFKGEE